MDKEKNMDNVAMFLDYLEYNRGYSKHTIISYKNDITLFENFIKREEFAPSLEKVFHLRICRYFINYLAEENYSKRSIARIISSLRSFYDYLFSNKVIDRNFFLQIPIPKQDKPLPDTLSHLEISHILDSIPRDNILGIRNYIIVDLLYSTGIRVQEAVNIKTSDIDLVEKSIKILGKGKKQRFVFFHKKLQQDLGEYIKFGRPKLQAKLDEQTNYLLLNSHGKQITTRGIRKILADIVLKLGETYHLHPHTLRHAFATVLLNNGADIRGVQELLGHESLSTTQIYTHISQDQLFQKFAELSPRSSKNIKKEEKNED